MLEPETQAFLESGCSIALASVDAAGQPAATRGWGLTVVPSETVRVRLLFDRGDTTAYENLITVAVAAVTAVSVLTFRATQMKGRVVDVGHATDVDRERAQQYCEAFLGDVHAYDGTAMALLERLPPTHFSACVIDIGEWFDQTPGPRAGAPIARPAS